MRFQHRALAVLLCALMLLPLIRLSPRAEAAEGDKRIIVSLGDSYSSGEGIEPFYDQNLPDDGRFMSEDWAAHRSEKCWSGMLTLPGVDGPMSSHRGENWYFAASSGAVTEHIQFTGDWIEDESRNEGEQVKDFDRGNHSGFVKLPGQLDIFNTEGLDPEDVDYVTLSIGGNDLGFVEVLTKAHNFMTPSEVNEFLQYQIEHFYDEQGIHDKIKAAYKRIADVAKNAKIIVVGYPELLDENGSGLFIDSNEAKSINWAVRMVDQMLRRLVKECSDEGMDIHYVSVIDAFKGHAAYSDDPYINPVYYGPILKDQDLTDKGLSSAYSMHPNEKGAAAYAACVQAKINELEGVTRNVALVIDASGSMSGEPLAQTKEAAHAFLDTVMPEDTAVGFVRYSSKGERWSALSMSKTYLDQCVNDISSGGDTNIEDGLRVAAEMLTGDLENKTIVLMSDGEATTGKTGDDLIAYANELKEQGITIYTLGFFGALGSKAEPQRVMEGIASAGLHYEIESVDDLAPFFSDMADQINGTPYVYVRMECPVNVRVTYNGETLSSFEEDFNTRTSFGTLTFEDVEGSDEKVKILRLREDCDYEIEIEGYDEGTMQYTAGYVDDNGEYSEMRRLEDVPITSDTVITTNTDRRAPTELRIDSDGDGKVDDTMSVGGKSVIELPDDPAKKDFPVLWVALGAAVVVGVTVFGIVLGRRRRRKRAATLVRTATSSGSKRR